MASRRSPSRRTGFELVGAKEFEEVMTALGPRVVARVRRTALRKSATRIARELRKSAPKQTGSLKKSIGTRNGKYSSFVGLNKKIGADGKAAKKDDRNARIRFYYKVLDLESERGEPLNPWFDDALQASVQPAADAMFEELKRQLAREAGKAYAKSRSRNGFKGNRRA